MDVNITSKDKLKTPIKKLENHSFNNDFNNSDRADTFHQNLSLKQRLLFQKEEVENISYKNEHNNFDSGRIYQNNSISSLSTNIMPTDMNNTSKKLRRFVNNRLFDVDLGKAKRSESPVKNDEKEYNIKNNSYILNNELKNTNRNDNILQQNENINQYPTQRFNSGSPIKPVKTINLKRSISAVHMSNAEENFNAQNYRPTRQLPNTIENRNILSNQNNINTDTNILNIPSMTPNEKVQVNGILYKKIELIGKGGTSKVYKIKRLFKIETLEAMKQQGIPTLTTFALKRVDFDHFDESSINFFKGEINILHKLQNKNRVVKLVDYEMKTDHINLVMECGSYSLSDVLANRKNFNFDFDFVKHHFKEICLCLKDVHDADIIHSDLKPANFVFVKGILKIIDFGIADSIPDNTVNIYRDKQFGTPNYMAPEALVRLNNNDTNYTGSNFVFDYNTVDNAEVYWKVGKPSDIWSLGCILYQMVYGDPPYAKFEGSKRLKAIMDPRTGVQIPQRDKTGNLIPTSLIKLISNCLQKASKKRPTLDNILYQDEFLNSISISKEKIKEIVTSSLIKLNNSKQSNSYGKLNDSSLDEIINELLNL
ncbi:kinase-like protein [Hanseniaspora valbyensis NRRL Y-1626]|uniref:Kinase-like protein n=1 Tax=Hanseniaspora valbyensis NRRL Y-1626 TaxID=766949 RepID=A0A1B7TFX6_9ASCO|nr:kinase-like protein [Hanseniaspora valbyensis NRRL Y-1626]